MSGNWVRNVVGDANVQYNNALALGYDDNMYTGNALLPIGFKGPYIGGKPRGGSLAGILGTAAVPFSLLALQNQYKGNRRFRSHKRRGRSRRSRRSRRR